MRTILETIEKSIQAIVESTLHIIPDQSHKALIASIINAIQENLTASVSAAGDLPNIYSIHVNPADYPSLIKENAWLEQIKQSLIEIAHEAQRHFLGPISVELIPDESLAPRKFELFTDRVASVIEQTAVFKTNIQDKQPRQTAQRRAFLILPGQKTFPLDGGIIQIGRRRDNHLVIDHPSISRNHAQIRRIQGNYVVFDLNSTSGTLVNGVRISTMTLNPGDVISMAGYTIIYGEEEVSEAGDHEKTSELPRKFGLS